ncbi:MAG: DUF4347 domain-containing protein [Flavobacteriales bacterium]|nr:DUF4347 domain-containing protein [Flavobacteriales bacterium]
MMSSSTNPKKVANQLLYSFLFLLFVLQAPNSWAWSHSQVLPNNVFIDGKLENLKVPDSECIDKQVFHLFSHGRPGELLVNGQWMDAHQIAEFLQPQVKKSTHINIYGCEFGKGKVGREAVTYLEKTLGISVAASDDITGVDGDWDLEVGNGNADILKLVSYQGNLQDACGDFKQAEILTLNGGVISNNNQSGYFGSGFADYPTSTGSNINVTWTETVATAGTYTLAIRYANADANPRPLRLKINGTVVDTFSMSPTSSWTNWTIETKTVSVNSGSNTFVLSADAGSQGPNVDQVQLLDCAGLNNPCNPTSPQFTDNDGDGIGDLCDEDDDNDGILDIDEGYAKSCSGAGNITASISTITADVHYTQYLGNGITADFLGGGTNTPYLRVWNETTTSTDELYGTGLSGHYIEPKGGGNYVDITFSTGTVSLSFAVVDIDNTGENHNVQVWDQNGNTITNLSNYIATTLEGTTGSYPSSVTPTTFNDIGSNIAVTENGTYVKLEGISTATRPELTRANMVVFDLSGKEISKIRITNNTTVTSYTPGILFNCVSLPNSLQPDFDSDGIPNYLDLDSDNDGCFDAIEGGGSYVYSKLNSSGAINTTIYSVDANGVPNNGGSQSVGSSQNTGVVVCCDAAASGYVDTDGDGVSDFCDLDDDNDGILDTNEFACSGSSTFNITWFNHYPNGSSDTTYTSVAGSGVNVHYTRELNGPMTSYGSPPEYMTLSSVSYATLAMDLNGGFNSDEDSINSVWTYEFSKEILIGSSFKIIDIERSANFGSWRDGVKLLAYDANNYPVPVSVTLGDSLAYDVDGFITNLTGQYSVATSNVNYWATFTISKPIKKLVIIYDPGDGGGNSNPQGQNIFLERLPNVKAVCDTDNDGIPNYLDTDSDGDGCADAIEGGGSYVLGQLYANGSINTTTYPVNTSGVPNNGSSQSIGSSQNASVVVCCDAAASGYPDVDGDGVSNDCDLDNDNDGILDTDEGACQSTTTYTLNVASTVAGASTAINGGSFNLVFNRTSGNAVPGIQDTFTVPFTYSDFNNTATSQDHQWAGVVTGSSAVSILPNTSLLAQNLPANNSTNETFIGNNVEIAFDNWLSNGELTQLGTFTTTAGALPTSSVAYVQSQSLSYFSVFNASKDASISVPGPVTAYNGYYAHPVEAPLYTSVGFIARSGTLVTNVTGTHNWIYTAFLGSGTMAGNGGSRGLISINNGTVTYCVSKDTDNDGTPDYLDTDSDGDGCADAIEGGGSYVYSQLNANGSINTTTYPVNTSGVPNNGSSQTIGSSQNASVIVCCDPVASGYPDADGDGISNQCDLDDDNDGILDTDESCSPTLSGTWSGSTGSTGSLGINITSVGVSGATKLTGVTNDVFNNINAWSNPSVMGATSYQFLIYWDTIPEPYYTDIDAPGDDKGIRQVTFNFSSPVRDFILHVDRLGGNGASGSSPYITNSTEWTVATSGVTMQKLAGNNQFIVESDVFYRIPDVNLGYTSPGPQSSMDSTGTAAGSIKFSSMAPISSITFNVTGIGIEVIGSDALEFIFEACQPIDTDGDGIPNYSDLDSDNDGCPDALEGGDYLTYSQIQNDTITGGVDSNGVPLSTSGGQSIGTSQIDTIQSAECDPCNAASSLFNDNDGDGIGDVCDLDDDNDGILDTEEDPGLCLGSTLSYSFSGTIDAARDRGNPNDVNRDLIFGDNFYFNLAFDKLTGVIIETTIGDWSYSRTGTATVDGQTLSFSTSAGSFQTLTFSPSIDSTYSIHVVGTDASVTAVVVKNSAGGVLAKCDFGLNGSPIASGYIGVTTDATATTIPSGTTAIDCSGVPALDTDNDGTPDYLDLDSDNDGCADAVEGGGSVGLVNLTNDKISGSVDANGVPVLVSGGQNIGTAQDSTVKDYACYPNSVTPIVDYNTTLINTPVDGNVKTNDIDAQGDATKITAIAGTPVTTSPVTESTAQGGTLIIDSTGNYTYTPPTGFVGKDSIVYTLCDNGTTKACEDEVLYITVLPVEDPTDPTSNTTVANPDEGVSYGDPVTLPLLANDGDPEGDNQNFGGVIDPTKGTPVTNGTISTVPGVDENGNPVADAGDLTVSPDGTITFTPNSDFVGVIETLYYVVCDTVSSPYTACDTTTIDITVLPNDPSHDEPPLAGDDYQITNINTPVTGNWLANDSDPNSPNDAITVNGGSTLVDPTKPGTGTSLGKLSTDQGGTVELFDDGTFVYTPPTDYTGPDKVVYYITDTADIKQTDSATIYLLIEPIYTDFGDLTSLPSAGAKFIDSDNNGTPDGTNSIWAGATITDEVTANINATATADGGDDGLIIPSQLDSATANIFMVPISSTNAGITAYAQLEIDWNNDGVMDSTYTGTVTTTASGNDTVIFNNVWTPDGLMNATVNYRVRVSDDPTDFSKSLQNNGEVEDFQVANVTPIPVELVYLNAEWGGNNAVVNWQTATELNNSHFVVERSFDGVNFEAVGVLRSLANCGNSSQNIEYQFVDYGAKTITPEVVYYQLVQVDFDGQTERFGPVALFNRKTAAGEVIIYPNPTSGSINIVKTDAVGDVQNVEITNIAGQVVSQFSISSEQLRNGYKFTVFDVPTGIYFIRISNGINSTIGKISIDHSVQN